MEAVRLGDIVDDHCSRCHIVMDHSVVAMVDQEVKRVRCRTCNHEHDYRHGKSPQTKKKPKLSAYDQVLASVMAGRPDLTTNASAGEKTAGPSRSRRATVPPRRSLPKR